MPDITVIVPVYKVEPYIHKCVDSILGQSFQDFDLVLVDDGSPDTCPQICDAYAAQDERIIVIHKKNGGLSDARNAGIDWAMEHSDSQWLAFVDSDDYLHPDYLKAMHETARRESADLVICDFIDVNDREETMEDEHSFFDLVTEDKERLFQILCSDWRIIPAWNKLYHKSIFAKLRFAFGKIHEDNFAIHHVLWECRRAALISEGLYYYRHRNNSIMATETPKSRLDAMEAQAELYEFGQEKNIAALKDGPPIDCLDGYAKLKPDFSKQDALRFKQLKGRFAKVYFRCRDNQNLKRYLGFYYPGLYRKMGALYRNGRSAIKHGGS